MKIATRLTSPTSQIHRLNNAVHRDNGPARVFASANGLQSEWWRHGCPHRDDGLPAVEFANGGRMWCVRGQVVLPSIALPQ